LHPWQKNQGSNSRGQEGEKGEKSWKGISEAGSCASLGVKSQSSDLKMGRNDWIPAPFDTSTSSVQAMLTTSGCCEKTQNLKLQIQN
jgi:hypothetical protein